jgi:hypothetical protein
MVRHNVFWWDIPREHNLITNEIKHSAFWTKIIIIIDNQNIVLLCSVSQNCNYVILYISHLLDLKISKIVKCKLKISEYLHICKIHISLLFTEPLKPDTWEKSFYEHNIKRILPKCIFLTALPGNWNMDSSCLLRRPWPSIYIRIVHIKNIPQVYVWNPLFWLTFIVDDCYCPTILTWHFINFRKGHLNRQWPLPIEYIHIFTNFTSQWRVVYW